MFMFHYAIEGLLLLGLFFLLCIVAVMVVVFVSRTIKSKNSSSKAREDQREGSPRDTPRNDTDEIARRVAEAVQATNRPVHMASGPSHPVLAECSVVVTEMQHASEVLDRVHKVLEDGKPTVTTAKT